MRCIQVDGKDVVAFLVFLDSNTTNAGFLEKSIGVSALDFLNLFFGSHNN